MNRNFPGGSAPEAQAQNLDPLVGRKVMSRWPEDNSFYEAVISDYNAETVRFFTIPRSLLLIQASNSFLGNSLQGLYALVYDINTANETWEWVDLKEVHRCYL
jgi:hypothetical protein